MVNQCWSFFRFSFKITCLVVGIAVQCHVFPDRIYLNKLICCWVKFVLGYFESGPR